MNNPAHNGPFNRGAENLDRQDLARTINTSHEWDEAKREAEELDAAAAERAAATVDDATDTIAARIAESAPEISPLAALEARRDSLQAAIKGSAFDRTNRENSAAQNWKHDEELDGLEDELEKVEAEIKNLTAKN
jgi:hypothetical protein